MTYMMLLCLVGLVAGLISVASNPSPFFAALGLVVAAGMGCGVLAGHGGSFLSLVLFLIYLGGMLVVFAYSAALAAEPYPEGWGNRYVAVLVVAYVVSVGVAFWMFRGEWYEFSWVPVNELSEFSVIWGDTGGVALMYSSGSSMLVISVWVLLLTLFVVLELTRGLSRGALRAV
ncbi:NADH dehydrogenase subunit 6 (mitochondrion) [Anabas testudineus]|uniref:NADH-ubiquinone oxidoreductase chain 6 n=1 Tax=Anabas testudineus TaxID=64144 RepID=A0A0K1W0C8_ANATE|nr:NADH dehydrogenase subunit 6 [Anabas testudineus]AIK19762.1 NADH dehydrogenase subunit 6 [Anabas testudineus]AKX33638.1 NADH dehydrogenase subunit 6 [Anabas testudineus]AQT00819.1 NADH dehydrogenase subunit 6 [Anabas testudineus]WPS67122.1 NADH dehydrogenase subunit 6 [Anabas testudineus]